MKKLAKILKQARKKMGITQTRLAEITGLTHKATISNIENASREIPAGHRRAYLMAVGLKLKDVADPVKSDLWTNWLGEK